MNYYFNSLACALDLFNREEFEKSFEKNEAKAYHQTAIELTKLQKSEKRRKNLYSNLLLTYLTYLTNSEHKNEEVSLVFVKNLVDEGSDVNYSNANLENSLTFVNIKFFKLKRYLYLFYLKAIQLGDEQLVEYLLEKGVQFNRSSKSEGFNVFHMIAKYENINIMKLIVDKFQCKYYLRSYFKILLTIISDFCELTNSFVVQDHLR